jgi:V/A-type H+-transporting ATPase subunit F
MYKIAVMGEYDSIYGFASLGLTTFPVDINAAPEEASRTLRTIAESGYGVIYMTESLAKVLEKDIAKYAGQLMPAIILIPGVRGNTGAGIQQVKKSVEQAVGSDILFGGES